MCREAEKAAVIPIGTTKALNAGKTNINMALKIKYIKKSWAKQAKPKKQ